MRAKAAARGVTLHLDSAGTGDWHIGAKPYSPMRAAARVRGYDLDALRARQVAPADFASFDLLLAMDAQNLADLQALGAPGRAELRLFTDFAPADSPADHVPDPYFTRDFEGALTLIEACADGLLDHLESARQAK